MCTGVASRQNNGVVLLGLEAVQTHAQKKVLKRSVEWRQPANEGPRLKRIRPAPMGRAFRYQRRTAHIVVTVAERAETTAVEPAEAK